MIITRTPLRMSFVGGGSDISSFYKQSEGAVVSTSINQYIYISLNRKFDKRFRLSYSITEHADHIKDLKHPLVRECLRLFKVSEGLEITSVADIPSKGTGLGSSSAFTVGLIHALLRHQNKTFTQKDLSELACDIEINKCREPIGKQDQYAAAFGGLNFIQFLRDGSVKIQKIKCDKDITLALEERILVFYTGITRSTSSILKEQTKNLNNKNTVVIMKKMVQLAHEMKKQLETNNLDTLGEILHENWMLKKQLTSNISNEKIDQYYDRAIKAGASGGKLMGAGSGGFLLFLVEKDKQENVIKALKELRYKDIKFEKHGSKLIYTDNL
ncbi:MAG: GHMP kinase [Candidatus Marinimicrobia bacterium]|nr:GHMP kinase [Candidatus Neomarinimicrobiota bacterium]